MAKLTRMTRTGHAAEKQKPDAKPVAVSETAEQHPSAITDFCNKIERKRAARGTGLFDPWCPGLKFTVAGFMSGTGLTWLQSHYRILELKPNG